MEIGWKWMIWGYAYSRKPPYEHHWDDRDTFIAFTRGNLWLIVIPSPIVNSPGRTPSNNQSPNAIPNVTGMVSRTCYRNFPMVFPWGKSMDNPVDLPQKTSPVRTCA